MRYDYKNSILKISLNEKIKVAILGGGIVASWYLDILKNSDISLEGICSRTFYKAEKLKKKYKIKNNFKNINDLYNKTKSDIVISTVSAEKYL